MPPTTTPAGPQFDLPRRHRPLLQKLERPVFLLALAVFAFLSLAPELGIRFLIDPRRMLDLELVAFAASGLCFLVFLRAGLGEADNGHLRHGDAAHARLVVHVLLGPLIMAGFLFGDVYLGLPMLAALLQQKTDELPLVVVDPAPALVREDCADGVRVAGQLDLLCGLPAAERAGLKPGDRLIARGPGGPLGLFVRSVNQR